MRTVGADPGGAAATEEAELVAAVAAGDCGAPMAALYRRYGSPLYGLGLRLLGDRGLAEEMVQDTFLRLWRAAPTYDPERGSVRTFTFTIARRAAVDMHRRMAGRPRVAAGGGDERDETPFEEGFDELVTSLDVRAALASLSDKHREVLELHFDKDLSQHEIADRLGVPLGTVKTRTYYGLRALKLELEERGLVD